MAWTLPTTITDGMAVTAANFNAWATENLKFLKGIGGATVTLDGPLTLPAGGAITIGTLMYALRTGKGQNFHVDGGIVTATIQDNGGSPNNTALTPVTFTPNFGSGWPLVVVSLTHNQVYTISAGVRVLGAPSATGFTWEAWTNQANTIVTATWIAFGQSAGGL